VDANKLTAAGQVEVKRRRHLARLDLAVDLTRKNNSKKSEKIRNKYKTKKSIKRSGTGGGGWGGRTWSKS
jgi:hypothetical protein